MNLADAIRAHARRPARHPAILYGGRSIDYADFDRSVDAAANFLHDRGIRPGDHVGIAIGDRPAHLEFLFGAARSGAVFVPIDRRWTPSEKQHICQHFAVKLMLCDPGDAANTSVQSVSIPDDWRKEVVTREFPAPSDANDDAALAVYLTSGTTGRPKGPVLTHANMRARFDIYQEHLRFNEEERFACVTPLYFSASRGFAMCILHAGGTLVLLPPPMAATELIAAINENECTSASLVPTLIRRMLGEHTGEGLCLPALRTLISTGAPLNRQERERALARLSPNIFTFYGSSEGGGVAVLAPRHPADRAESAGEILPGTEVRIVDEEMEDVQPGAIGHICYRSPATARAFFNDPEQSAATFRNGWFFPGDLGRIESRFIYITGREKDMILRGGANIYPEEIERVLRAHPNVADAAVVGVPSQEFGEEVVACVSLWNPATDEELLDWCRRDLAPYKVPRRILRLADLPKTPIGKTDKNALKAEFERKA